ncbi:ArsR family transcriptional regulator [Thermococcus sp. M39]|uniref:helix-turn-helix domain-containing protein n=1 Tax=Thermococcus sp. M39 TaxID=1638262 RepID=UPI00143A00CB|nr:helix-turn-helix domain-containing protein [Thermococcus sp. M39]NJE07631.1 ArsR family transcriptional regulator [Thermococcus sp. M39]
MKHLKILNVLEGKELTIVEISKETKMSLAEVRKLLLRLAEQGKVESLQREGKIFWKIKQKTPEEEKFKYV